MNLFAEYGARNPAFDCSSEKTDTLFAGLFPGVNCSPWVDEPACDESDAAVVHLMSMWVDPALRGSGAGEALVASLLAWAETEGARQIRLAVIQTTDRARRFYERLGFRENGRQSVRERDGAIEVEMERGVTPVK